MCRLLDLAHGFVQDILDDVVDVGTAEALRGGAEGVVILIREIVWGFPDVHAKNMRARGFVWKWDVDSLVEPTSHGLIQRVRRVRRREH